MKEKKIGKFSKGIKIETTEYASTESAFRKSDRID